MVFIKIKLKNKIFAICLSLIAIGCAESPNNNGGGSPPPALTCSDDVQVCSPPHLTALYGSGVFYFNEDPEINQSIKIHEGDKQTFYAIVHDSDILSGESISVAINSIPINLNANTEDNLNDYFSLAFKRTPENVPSALENYTNANGYGIFIFTLGETLLLDDRAVGEYEISIIPTDAKGLEGIDDIFKVAVVIENVNDAPIISALTHSDGVTAGGENTFEVFEGGDSGTIKVVVDDADIQHGDIVGLNIISSNLPAGVISLERNKLSLPDARNNQVEFTFHIASDLLQDTDIGEYQFRFLVDDEFGGEDSSGYFTLKVKDTDDVSIANYTVISGGINKPDDSLDNFAISEGQSGQIKVEISDEDLIHISQLEYAITGDPIRKGLLNITKVKSLPSAGEHIFLIDIGRNGIPIDDVDIGNYSLNLQIFDASADRRVDALYPFVLEIKNVPERTDLVNVQAGKGAVAGTEANYFVLTEKISASLNIIVMDEDLVNPLTQENITMKILSTDLPNDLLLAKNLYVSRPDTVGGNQATFVLGIAAPRNEDVQDDNYTITFTVGGTDDISSAGKISIRIENGNDVPVISSLTSLGGVGRTALPVEKDTFIVFEGGVNGAITVTVEDPDIQHGDIVSLNISNNALLGDATFIDKYFSVESNLAAPNQVEFTIHIASELIQDIDIGVHQFSFSAYDKFGGIDGSGHFTLKVKNTEDASSARYAETSGGVNKLQSVDGIPDTFTISEGQSGQIKVTISDEDLIHTSQLEYAITGDPIRKGLLNITRVEPSSSTEEHIFLIDVGKNDSPIDDADIGSYNLSLHVADADGTVNANYTFILKFNNVDEQPTIIDVLAGAGVSATASGNSWTLTEDVAGSLSVVVEDEDFGSSQNQERINITTMSSTLPENFITIQQSEISYLDSPTNNRVTFRIEFAAPTNQLVGEHNITFSFTDTNGNTALYKREFKIKNVNDAPVISILTRSGGVIPAGENIFEVFEGGDNGTIKVIVDDVDIQHGDIIGLNITDANSLAGVISIEKDKLSQSDAINNRVKFVLNVASGLLRDTDIGEHQFRFLVYDEFGGIDGSGHFTLKVKNTDDASSANYSEISGMVKKQDSVDGIPDTFAISEGQSGQIKVTISDEDLSRTSQLAYTITGDPIRKGLLNITRVEPLPSTEEHIFLIDIGKNGSPIDDVDIGSYNLNLRVTNDAGTVNANYLFILKVNNVDEQPTIIDVLAGAGVSASASDNSWELSEDIAGSLSVVVEDEDFGSSQNQESLRIAIMSSTLPKDLITIQQSEISSPDISTNNRVTFRIEFAAPTNQLVGEHNITFSFTDTEGNTALYKREFKIENVNDAPVISSLTHSGGVTSIGENIFEVYEGGEDGIIRVTVRDVDIQHGDNVSLILSITDANLSGIISIEEDQLPQSDTISNQVEFVLNVASGLLRDANIGEHQFHFLVYDGFGRIEDGRTITLKVKDTDDVSSINYLRINGDINKLDNVDGIPDTFKISEEESGQIKVEISDEDLIHPSQLEYTITGDSIRQGIREGLLNITRVEPLPFAEEHTFFIDIGKNSGPIDDADIGSYNLNLHIFDVSADRRVDANYSFVLEINNMPEPTTLINVQAGKGAVAGIEANYFVLTEKVSASIDIIVMDEDLVNPLAQENITMDILSSSLPNDLLLTKSLYATRPDIVGGNQATFTLEIAAPRNKDVRDNNYTIPFVARGAGGGSLIGDISIRIENVNDVPVISSLTHSGGVGRAAPPVEENTFIVSEGGVNGTIKITVDDPDIQHGDIVSLNISNNELLGDSAFIDKYFLVESNKVGLNQVEFIVNVASELMQFTDIGKHHFQLSVYDNFGGSATLDLFVIVEYTNDLTTISNLGWTGDLTRSAPTPSNGRDLFTIYEGQSGQIEFTLSDEDLSRDPLIVYNITGDSIDSQIISWAIRTKPSSPEERILTIDIGSSLIGSQQIDDAHVGTYELSLNVSSSAGEVELSYPFTLQIINVEEQPRIIKISPYAGASIASAANSFILTQDATAVFRIIVEDEDFANPQNQENITIAASHPTDPHSPFLTLVSYKSQQINMPDSVGGKNATFEVKIAKPPNDFVGENTLSITAIDSSMRTAHLDLNLTLRNVNDAPRIVDITSSGSVRRSSVDNFVVAEGASPNGGINVIVEDIDFLVHDSVSLAVASTTLDAKFLSIVKAHIDESEADSNHQVTFNIDIPSESLNDAEVGTHILEISVTDTDRESITHRVNLVIENVNDVPRIVNIAHTGEISKTLEDGVDVYLVNEGSSGVLNITLVDEDLIHSHESIIVEFPNPISSELYSVDKTFFSSGDAIEGGIFNIIIRLGEDIEYDDRHVDNYTINLLIADGNGGVIGMEESRIFFKVVNVPERPFFTQDKYDINVFELSATGELPAGTVIATIGEEYCRGISSISGCGSPLPVIEASDPDPGDAARLSYALEHVNGEYVYIDGLQIKTLSPLNVESDFYFRINVTDPNGDSSVEKPSVHVYIKGVYDSNDFDNDGVNDPYDGAPANAAIQTIGRGTHTDPYLIHNIYQLQAIAGVDHQGNRLSLSDFTGKSYLYGNRDELKEQLSSHYRLANNIDASLASTWNNDGGFMPIGVGACDSGTQQCDTATADRQVTGSPARFSGRFDGANFKISGLTVNRQSSYLGLFGAVGDGGVIANLKLTSAKITNPAVRSVQVGGIEFSYGGLLVGQMLGGTIDNVHVAGTLSGVGSGYGGVVGALEQSGNGEISGIIKDSMANVVITANGDGFGGLVGILGANSFIHASNAKGNIMPAFNNNGELLTNEVGGLVGVSDGNIFASYASGDVHGFHNVGGLVGSALNGTTTASFSAGDVAGISSVGGLFGEIVAGTHRYLYYSGQLVRSSYITDTHKAIGGIVGTLWPEATIYSVINIRSSYFRDVLESGLIFGKINLIISPMTNIVNIPNIHNVYSVNMPDHSLGFISHPNYGDSQSAPDTELGDNSMSIKLILNQQLRHCAINGKPSTDGLSIVCTSFFNNDYWRSINVSSLGSTFNIGWLFLPGAVPTLQVQRVTGTGALDGVNILPSRREQRDLPNS